MENGPKNFIPEDVLDKADGDPRAAFGTMALEELAAIEQSSVQKEAIMMKAVKEPSTQTPRDVWSRMDDI